MFLRIPAMIQSHISNVLIALFSSLASQSQCFHNSLTALNNRNAISPLGQSDCVISIKMRLKTSITNYSYQYSRVRNNRGGGGDKCGGGGGKSIEN